MDANTFYQQGLTHYKAGDYESGLACFTHAINQNYQPLDAAYYERSKCYEALDQLDAAKADLAHMLTLSIAEARRKQVTDLIALLDQAEVNTLPPPNKMPKGVKVEKNEAGLTIRVVTSRKLIAVIGMLVLYGSVGGCLHFTNYYMPFLIGSLLGLAYISYMAVLWGRTKQTIITINNFELKVSQNPSDDHKAVNLLCSAMGQIRCQRNIGNKERSPQVSYTLITDNQTILIELTNYDQVRYIQWKLRQHLNLPDTIQPDEYTPAKEARSLAMTTPINKMSMSEFGCFSLLSVIFCNLPGLLVYFMLENYLRHYDLFTRFSFVPFIIGLVLACAFLLHHVWLSKKLANNGRIALSTVVYKHHRTWHHEGEEEHRYEVYYRYYDYEAVYSLPEADFNQIEEGDIIKIYYLPDKPNTSYRYPLTHKDDPATE